MRKRKWLNKGVALLTVFFATVSLCTTPVHAGTSKIVVDEQTYTEKIDLATWSNPDSKVVVENNKLLFPSDSTSDTRLITKSSARESDMHDVLVEGSANLNLQVMPENEKFIFAFALSSIEGLPGDSGNIEVQFTNENGVKVAVVEQSEDGEKAVIAKTSCGKLGSTINVVVTIMKEGTLTLKINNKVLGKGQLTVSGEGRVGFLQTGSCAVQITNVNIVSYRYDTPENSDIFEDFESGSMNINQLTSYMNGFHIDYAPSYARVEELDGNKVFMCKNTGEVYLGTMHQYSNFEISFDVPYLQRIAERNEKGEITTPTSVNFLIAWGSTEKDPKTTSGYEAAEQKMVFYPGGTISPLNYGDTYTVNPEAYPFFSPSCEKGFSIKMSVIDTVSTVYIKWIDETEWTKILECQLDTKTPLGYVQLWLLSPSNIAIDNFSVVNKDKNPQLIDVEAKYSYMQTAEDYQYVKEENVYKNFSEDNEKFNWYLLIPITVGVCAIILGAEVGLLALKKKRKGGKNNAE